MASNLKIVILSLIILLMIFLETGQAIVSAVTSGSKRFFLGTDSAPHERQKNECSCGCAGMYNALVAISLHAKVFEEFIEQVEVQYVPEKAEFDGHLDEEFRKVFEKFNFKEIVGSEENDKKDETAVDSASKNVDSDSEEEEQDTHQKEKRVSNKKKKLIC
ncbi:hypothetical protein ACSBR1_043638 [Camellia fascicularis]